MQTKAERKAGLDRLSRFVKGEHFTCACGAQAVTVLGSADIECGMPLCKPHLIDKLNERRAQCDAAVARRYAAVPV